MSIFSKILNSGIKDITDSVGGILDNIITSDDEKSSAKLAITSLVTTKLMQLIEAQASVIRAEMSGNWLQRSWRPIVMLGFVILLMCKWFGFTSTVSPEMELELMALIKIGLGGYVVGRSVEKVTDKVTQNIDLTFLKKKDRAQ